MAADKAGPRVVRSRAALFQPSLATGDDRERQGCGVLAGQPRPILLRALPRSRRWNRSVDRSPRGDANRSRRRVRQGVWRLLGVRRESPGDARPLL